MRKPKWTTQTWIEFLKNLIKIVTGNKVSISEKNGKMGRVPSVSLPSLLFCTCCGCWKKCYANRMEKRRKTIREAYARNAKILLNNPEEYWRQVKEVVRLNRFFRFHVSGDIPNYEYFCKMIETANENEHCDILCFTKKYRIVNKWIDEHGKSAECLPKNLHMVFSAWDDLKMENPYNLPEAHIEFKNGKRTAPEGKEVIKCFGCCEECYLAGCGCWKLKPGEAIEFKEH